MTRDLSDWIQDRVIARADELQLNANEIATRTNGAVSDDHVRDYLNRKKSMGSHKLAPVLRVLGLDVVPAK